MSKKRKTLKDKRHSDERRAKQLSSPSPSPSQVSYSFSAQKAIKKESEVSQSSPSASPVMNHDYVYVDMKKTLFITAVLLGANTALYFAWQYGLVHMSFLGL